jgi:hypothetical protein
VSTMERPTAVEARESGEAARAPRENWGHQTTRGFMYF